MDEIQIFTFNGKSVRGKLINNEPWFVLIDLCDILDVQNRSQVSDRLDTDEVCQTYIQDSRGHNQETLVVNESGLYNVILRSDKPIAKPFRKWVTSDVLPSIRKHGFYGTKAFIEQAIADPDATIELMIKYRDERRAREAAEAQMQLMAPKAAFADAIHDARDGILIHEMAAVLVRNGFDTGEKRLYAWMRDNGYVVSGAGRSLNQPTQRALDLGVLDTHQSLAALPNGNYPAPTTLVTGRGQQYFLEKFQELNMPRLREIKRRKSRRT